jgi:hypothetical protein
VTVSFQFQLFLFIEALQGVHRARREHQEVGRNFSVRNPLDLNYRDPLDARSAREIRVCTRRSSGGITLQEVLSKIQEPISPGGAKVKTFEDLENSSKSERLKSSGGGALLTVRS